jgi:WYL domain
MAQATLCEAIASRNLVRFYYAGDAAPGDRTVEPHMVAYNAEDNLVLSAWYVSGASESYGGPGWREYLLSEMTNVTALPQQFAGPRPKYKRTGGKLFHNIQCAL